MSSDKYLKGSIIFQNFKLFESFNYEWNILYANGVLETLQRNSEQL